MAEKSYHEDPPYGEEVLYRRSCEWAVQQHSVSTWRLQLQFKIGYNLATRLLDRMVEIGVIALPPGDLN
ncbi:MAG: DNA translocase FtsK [Pseudomonadota bacterium]